MRLMEAQMEEFKDPAAIKAMDPREVVAWIEVSEISTNQSQPIAEAMVFFLVRCSRAGVVNPWLADRMRPFPSLTACCFLFTVVECMDV